MATFSKKDILSSKKINELINPDGSEITGDNSYDTTSQINVGTDRAGSGAQPVTTDKNVKSVRQGVRPYGSFGYYSGSGNIASNRNNIIDANVDDESEENLDLEEASKIKMKKMVEEILTQKLGSNNDVVKKSNNPDVNRNNIPDIVELKTNYNNPVAANTAIDFVKQIKSIPLNGDSLGIVLNYILANIDTSSLSNDYKNIIKNQIK